MKALLMAAGRGTRISRYLNGNPKCTVDIGNGTPLIKYTIDMLKKKGVGEIVLATGYRHEVLEKILKNDDVLFVYNPFFDVTNSIASAWFARNYIDDDMLIMNADVFCEEKIYDKLFSISCKESPIMLYDTSRRVEADYKFYCENDCLKKYGKGLTIEETSGEYVGIARFDKNFNLRFLKQMEDMIDNQEHDVWWENVLYSLIDKIQIRTIDVAGDFWAEVDYIEDYERIKEFVMKNEYSDAIMHRFR